jgi:hypothetical protein
MSKTTIRNGVIALLLITIAAAVFGLMVYKVIAQGDQLGKQVAVLEEERAREATYYHLQRIESETVPDREQLRSHFLFNEGDSINFLNQVEALAPEEGVVLKTNELQRVTDKVDQTEWIQVQFSFSGSRERVQNFIQILENLPYVLRITGVDMSVRSSTEWTVNLTLRVRVLAYDE